MLSMTINVNVKKPIAVNVLAFRPDVCKTRKKDPIALRMPGNKVSTNLNTDSLGS
jgi:hypothetical protein